MGRYPELDGVTIACTVPSPQPFNYRNHARFTVRRSGSLGFTNRITRRFVRVDECMLMTPGINGALAELQGKCSETTQLSVRYGVNTGDFLVQPTLQHPAIGIPSGQSHYVEELLGRRFRVASPSFFQVNTHQAEHMARMVRDRLELTGADTLLDAYAGVGTFAVLLAGEAGRVIAIEESSAAVRDTALNAEGVDNVEFVESKTEDALKTLDAPVDAVILDPPRSGCDPRVLTALARLAPRRIAYVSCDPSTLARDLALLAGVRYDSARSRAAGHVSTDLPRGDSRDVGWPWQRFLKARRCCGKSVGLDPTQSIRMCARPVPSARDCGRRKFPPK